VSWRQVGWSGLRAGPAAGGRTACRTGTL